jgi:hypothetical protein
MRDVDDTAQTHVVLLVLDVASASLSLLFVVALIFAVLGRVATRRLFR